MKSKNENKQNGKRDNPEAENSLQFVHICKLLVCGSVGRGFFRVRVTSIEHICNMKHTVPLSSLGSSNSLFQKYWWFSVSHHSKQIKIKIKTVQQIKSGIWEIKRGKYTKTLAKIQARRIFRIKDIRRNVLPKFIEICMETPCWCSPG